MDIHYETSSQISKRAKYEFKLPKYGPSTTDPTYYEPTATRIANMKKAGGQYEGLYDFTCSLDTKGKTKEQIYQAAVERAEKETSEGVVDVRFSKHGLTREEISQVTMEKSLQAETMLKDKKDSAVDNTKQLKKELEMAEAISNKISDKASPEADNVN